MTNKFGITLRTSILLLGVSLAALTMLASCENFLKNGKDVKDEVLDSIAYNNAPSCTVSFADEGKGEFLGNKKETFKIGYASQIQFEVKKDYYYFVGLQAVTNNTEKTPLAADYVKFEPVDDDDRNAAKGIYKYNVTILKEGKDILIRPECLEYPAITSYTPSSSDTPNPVYTPIIINFNKSVDPKTIKDNVSIKGNGSDMSDYFEEAVLEESVLTIKPKALELQQFLNTRSVIDIKISLNAQISVTEEGHVLPLKQDSNSSFSVRYNNEMEQEPPKVNDFFVSAYDFSLDSIEQFDGEKFTMELFNVSTKNPNQGYVMNNRFGNTLYIYGNYYDKDSGVKSVTVSARRTHSNTADSVNEEEYEKTYTKDSEEAEFISDGTGNTIFRIKHTLTSYDGAYRINVTVSDFWDNPSETKTFIAIKNGINTAMLESYFRIRNIPNKTTTYEEYQSNLKNIKVIPDGYYRFYGQIQQRYYSNFDVYCEYTDKNGIKRNEKFSDYDTENQWWSLDLDVDSVNNLPFTLKYVNEFGLEYTRDYSFPGTPLLDSYSLDADSEDNKYNFIFSPPSMIVFKHDSQNKTYAPESVSTYTGDSRFSCYPGFDYYVCGMSSVSHNALYGELEVLNIDKLISVPDVTVTDVTFSKSEKWQYFDITITIAQDSWQNYDSIYVKNIDNSFEKNTFTYSFSEHMEQNPGFCIVYGTKGLLKTEGTRIDYTIDKQTLDNEAPSFYYRYQSVINSTSGADYLSLELKDRHNKLTYGYLGFGVEEGGYFDCMDTDGEENIDSGYIFNIPIWLMEENSSKGATEDNPYSFNHSTKIYCETYDDVGNSDESVHTFNYTSLTPFTLSGYHGGTTCTLVSKSFSENNLSNATVFIAKLSEDESESDDRYNDWIEQRTLKQNKTVDYRNKRYILDDVQLPENSFAKILVRGARSNGVFNGQSYFSDAVYVYTGDVDTWNSGDYDFISPNGTSKTSVVVSSDAPVFIHTLATAKPYSECKDWSVEEWEHHHIHFGDKYIDFKTNPRSMLYRIPMDIIENWKCYVVIVHYADGSTAMSEVFEY